jgi:hypothetical protein
MATITKVLNNCYNLIYSSNVFDIIAVGVHGILHICLKYTDRWLRCFELQYRYRYRYYLPWWLVPVKHGRKCRVEGQNLNWNQKVLVDS